MMRRSMQKLASAGFMAVCLSYAQNNRSKAEAEANLGVQEAQQQNFRAAIQHYQLAAQLDPTLPDIYLDLGLAYFKSGAFGPALKAFQKEESRGPSDRTKTLVAMSYFGLGQYKEAANALQPIAATQPGNTEILYLLAKCYVWSGQYD
ncbi:MAG: tetratricopeptide repeat protein, partial [Acidobacteriaceae bacterium]|nr:tetratricopeptide repeat protein [Acidobacteriaceae bacterium]